MGVFERSWNITKLSFDVINKDRELLLFPVLAGIFSLLFIVAILVPTIVVSLLKGAGAQAFGGLEYLLLFVTYLVLAFVATFFNVCVVYTAKKRFEGGNATFGESISFALSRVHLILMWSLLAATVGIILRAIDRSAEKAGGGARVVLKIMTSLLGMMWSIITIFVVPAMVYNNLGPVDAIKKSVQVLRKTWGESLVRHFGLGLVQFIFIIIGIVIAIPLFILLAMLGPAGVVAGIGIFVVYFLGVFLVFGLANTVFNTALYAYADTGKIPSGYSEDIMKGAFEERKESFMGRGIV